MTHFPFLSSPSAAKFSSFFSLFIITRQLILFLLLSLWLLAHSRPPPIISCTNSSSSYLQAHHFASCDVALPGFEKFFQQMADEQHLRAATLTRYQSLRGGVAMMLPVSAPATNNWGTGLEAMERALELEKSVNQVSIFSVCMAVSSLEG